MTARAAAAVYALRLAAYRRAQLALSHARAETRRAEIDLLKSQGYGRDGGHAEHKEAHRASRSRP